MLKIGLELPVVVQDFVGKIDDRLADFAVEIKDFRTCCCSGYRCSTQRWLFVIVEEAHPGQRGIRQIFFSHALSTSDTMRRGKRDDGANLERRWRRRWPHMCIECLSREAHLQFRHVETAKRSRQVASRRPLWDWRTQLDCRMRIRNLVRRAHWRLAG